MKCNSVRCNNQREVQAVGGVVVGVVGVVCVVVAVVGAAKMGGQADRRRAEIYGHLWAYLSRVQQENANFRLVLQKFSRQMTTAAMFACRRWLSTSMSKD